LFASTFEIQPVIFPKAPVHNALTAGSLQTLMHSILEPHEHAMLTKWLYLEILLNFISSVSFIIHDVLQPTMRLTYSVASTATPKSFFTHRLTFASLMTLKVEHDVNLLWTKITNLLPL
jgi:hypothetical protein